MEFLSFSYILSIIAAIILQVIILVKFFALCNDIKTIRTHIVPEGLVRINSYVVKYYAATGRADEMYAMITDRLFYRLESVLLKENDYSITGQKEKAAKYISNAENLCAILNRELPAQLKSVEAFMDYMA